MQRTLLIGCGGAGKSTLARKMARLTELPLIHLDQHYWGPHWTQPSKGIWTQQIRDLIAAPTWIMDGNYGGTMDLRMERADTITFLNMPTWLCLLRVFKRVTFYWRRSRPDMPADCPERFSGQFFWYIARYNATRRPKILAKLAELPADKQVFILSSKRQVNSFLHQIKKIRQ